MQLNWDKTKLSSREGWRVEGVFGTFPVHPEGEEWQFSCEKDAGGLTQSSPISLGRLPLQRAWNKPQPKFFFGKKNAIPCENDPSLA